MVGLLVATLALTVASPAGACVNATGASEQVFALKKAEKLLEEGDYREARRLGTQAIQDGDPDERERGGWVVAMSFVRDGAASREDLVGAVATMREVRAKRTLTDVPSRVDLAEALSRLPESHAEALAILRPLVTADLVGSAHAYAALGQIADDPALRRLAIQRCETTALDPSFCVRGFVPQRSDLPARWVPRALVGLGAIATIAVVFGIVRVVRRLRQRRAALDAFG